MSALSPEFYILTMLMSAFDPKRTLAKVTLQKASNQSVDPDLFARAEKIVAGIKSKAMAEA